MMVLEAQLPSRIVPTPSVYAQPPLLCPLPRGQKGGACFFVTYVVEGWTRWGGGGFLK